jgi:23S rRNA (cytosine1962-C5)-methyltransferase
MKSPDTIQLLTPRAFADYELLDCGDFQKLERFGQYITIRPEPQAVWKPAGSMQKWEKQAHVRFVPKSSSSGEWKKLKQMPDQWQIRYKLGAGEKKSEIQMRLALTGFKHVGVFPEQAANWDRIYDFLSGEKQMRFLNLFAYTGGASLAARAAGAEVTHVDSIRQVVTWANDNMKLSKLDNIRWMIDDALKFVKKEGRRGTSYQCIILDPPAYGHGPAGEKWKLEDQIAEMMDAVLGILDPEKHLLILNAYSLGFSAIVPHNLLRFYAANHDSTLSSGELYLPAASGFRLPLGVWGCVERS